MQVITIEVASLGNRCHLVHDGRVALVVDPPRDIALVEQAASDAEVEIAAVADTHLHNDYVSGALQLSRRHGADYLLSERERVGFERVGVRHGDHVPVGELDVEVVATPGHTRHHQSFLARRPGTGEPAALFSGGSLLHGTLGRTDLVDPELTRQLARAQWSSVRTLATLDSRTRVHPTHGFGSFCASGPATPTQGEVTIADQLIANPALSTDLRDKEKFVSELVSGFGPVPAYYQHMAPINRRGSGTPLPARRATADEVSDAVLAGAWVIDLRDRATYAAGHLPGSVGLEYSAQFATYAGWLVPWGDDIVLLTDSPELLEPALRDLARIGIDGVGAHVLTREDELTATYRRTDWDGFREALRVSHPLVVDVRQLDEWTSGHLPGALHLPVQDVERAAPTLPRGELWVHCKSGYRAGIAASLLHRLGHAVVHVDDSWDRVGELAIATTRAAA
jgi:glyoxylase-like metal-dependent hydrolase (beta-lactamase superfamily II)